MNEKLKQKLNNRKLEGTLRSLSYFDDHVDFCSNDYLGFAKLPFKEKYLQGGGSTGSRLISGNSEKAQSCEAFLSAYMNSESSLVFNSGYTANLGLFSSVPQKGDTVIYDESIHASIRDGIRLSNARSISFKHNSIKELSRKLKLSEGTIYVAVESLYSMDGDFAPLANIAEICSEFNAKLIVDEAHTFGLYGNDGRGIVNELAIEDLVFARVITFGKAIGFHGAAVIGKKDLTEYLINFSRAFIYTTALPPSDYLKIMESIKRGEKDSEFQKLKRNISHFRDIFSEYELTSDVRSPIQMLRIGEIEKLKGLSEELNAAKFAVKPIYSPTVSVGNEALRICLHSYNTNEEVDLLFRKIKDYFQG